MKNIKIFFLLSAFIFSLPALSQVKNDISSNRVIESDFLKPLGKFSRVYEECIGAGRANEGLRADWQQQLLTIKKEIGFKYIRFHGLLCDDMHVYTEDKQGNPLYNWQYVDKLYDYLLSI